MVNHLCAVKSSSLDGLKNGDASLLNEVIHLVDGDPAVRSYEAEGVGADGESDAALVSSTEVLVCTVEALLNNSVAWECVKLWSPLWWISSVPSWQEADGRSKEGTLLAHKVHGLCIKLEAVNHLLAAATDGVISCGEAVVGV